MTHEEMEQAIDVFAGWTDEAADVLNRLADRMQALEVKMGDLNSRFDEWDIRR
jgi:hypothetical protein